MRVTRALQPVVDNSSHSQESSELLSVCVVVVTLDFEPEEEKEGGREGGREGGSRSRVLGRPANDEALPPRVSEEEGREGGIRKCLS